MGLLGKQTNYVWAFPLEMVFGPIYSAMPAPIDFKFSGAILYTMQPLFG